MDRGSALAGLVAAGLIAALLGGCGTTQRSTHGRSTLRTTTTVLPIATTSSTAVQSTTTTTSSPPATLSLGASGPSVLSLQQRLSALGYWLGTPDGTFGDTTEQAVYALQKAAGINRDGVVGPETERALDEGIVPQPRPTTASMVQVDLEDDLLMIVQNGKLEYTLNTSTGGGYSYTDGGVTALADTPTGEFAVYREVDGMVVDSLGELWRPKYFDDGFAIHGDSYVPPYAVSHGCVRISDEAIDWVWSDDIMPLGTTVWIYS